MTSKSTTNLFLLPFVDSKSSRILSLINSSRKDLSQKIDMLHNRKALESTSLSLNPLFTITKKTKLKKVKSMIFPNNLNSSKKQNIIFPPLKSHSNSKSKSLSKQTSKTKNLTVIPSKIKRTNIINDETFQKQVNNLKTVNANSKTIEQNNEDMNENSSVNEDKSQIKETIIERFTRGQRKLTRKLTQIDRSLSSSINNILAESKEISIHNRKMVREAKGYLKYLNGKINIKMDVDFIDLPIEAKNHNFYRVLDNVIGKIGSLNPLSIENMLNKLKRKNMVKNKYVSTQIAYEKNHEKVMRLIDLSSFRARKMLDKPINKK